MHIVYATCQNWNILVGISLSKEYRVFIVEVGMTRILPVMEPVNLMSCPF
jgi:hypothetical protein